MRPPYHNRTPRVKTFIILYLRQVYLSIQRGIGHDHNTDKSVVCKTAAAERSFQLYSAFTGRMTSGSCGPLSGFDVKKGRPTIIVFRVISVGGTASSKLNDRTKENRIAFILDIPRSVRREYTTNALVTTEGLTRREQSGSQCMHAGR
jgi:hypothetical protein